MSQYVPAVADLFNCLANYVELHLLWCEGASPAQNILKMTTNLLLTQYKTLKECLLVQRIDGSQMA